MDQRPVPAMLLCALVVACNGGGGVGARATGDVGGASGDARCDPAAACPPRPRIRAFAASPAAVQRGRGATLTWEVTGATDVSIDGGVGRVSGSTVSVTPDATTTYTLTASNAAGGEMATATVTVIAPAAPGNGPPLLPPLADVTNSAETLESSIALPTRDPDGEPLTYAVGVSDPSVATAAVDPSGTLVLTPRARGSTTVTVRATDRAASDTRTFQFTVSDVSKVRQLDTPVPREQVVAITNTSGHDVAFDLTHNGRLLATAGDQLLAEAGALADDAAGEPFERKLWRYVRDGTYHFSPLTEDVWQHDPLLFLNSVGFGFCDDVAAVYVSLARRAGYTARAWGLTGHVVPEVLIGGEWAMYDPDLAVYYLDAARRVVGVERLAADPALVTSPTAPVSAWSWPYSPDVAAIYASTADNSVLGDAFFVEARDAGRLRLAPRARLTYPGRWAATPVSAYGSVPPASAQLRLELPPGFVGTLDWPLVPWDVQGSGRVRVAGVEYAAGSSELAGALQRPSPPPPRPVDVIEATAGLAVVYLVNPIRFGLRPGNTVAVRSVDAWALDVEVAPVPEGNRVSYSDTSDLVRPR